MIDVVGPLCAQPDVVGDPLSLARRPGGVACSTAIRRKLSSVKKRW
jgi:hypothetical protein